jgi:hypothetical protein
MMIILIEIFLHIHTKTKCIYLPDYMKCIVSKCDIFQISSHFPPFYPFFPQTRRNKNRDTECFEELVEKDVITYICQNHAVATLFVVPFFYS